MKIKNPKLSHLILNEKTKDKLTRAIIELSFWDNSSVVDYTCKIFRLLWKKSVDTPNFGMRSDIEKIIEYIFLRRYQHYYDHLGDSSNGDSNIKLSVLEILTKHLNHLFSSCGFLLTAYINYDFSKVRFNIINELFSCIQRYYTLHNPRFFYLKKLITLTYLVAFNEISSHAGVIEDSHSLVKMQETLSETWLELQRMVNNGKFKKIYSKLCELFGLKEIPKGVEISSLPQEEQTPYRKIARAMACLIKYSYYIDINILFEVIAENHEMSKLILEEYANTFDFKGLDIIRAYELYVSTFKLTGEQYHIYNFIVKFANKYFNDNFGASEDFHFKSEEEVSTFAYSIMILNTDLHNPNVAHHMSCEAFIKNNQATKLFDDFPIEYFRNVYKAISSDPLKAAFPRINNYIKEDEVFLGLGSRKYYKTVIDGRYDECFPDNDNISINTNTNKIDRMNVFAQTVMNVPSVMNLECFPVMNAFEDFSCSKEIKTHPSYDSNIKAVYHLLWEDLFYNFIGIPHNFYEMKDDNVLKVLESVCKISIKTNQKDNIDKIIVRFIFI